MKRAIPALLGIVLLFCAFSVSASAEEEPDWRTEYLDFIVDDHYALTPDKKETTTYQVMYIASNEIPFIYISRGNTAGGGAFLYVDEDKVVIEQTSIMNFEYVEKSDAYFISDGRMGYYGDGVYVIEDSDVTLVGVGSYGGAYGLPLRYDTDAESVNTYTWNNSEVTREEYQREYYGLRDKYLTPEDEVIYVDGYGYDGCSYEEIITWFTEQDEPSASEAAFSGAYIDVSTDQQLASRINFDCQNETFIFSVNLLEAWGIVEGTYDIHPGNIIECKVVTGNGFMNTDSGEQPVIRFSVGNDMITLLDELRGGGFIFTGGPDFERIGDGFTVDEDSGTGTVTGEGVRLRSGPGTDYNAFTSLYTGDRVSITGRSGDWYRVTYTYSEGYMLMGFMHSDYVAKD